MINSSISTFATGNERPLLLQAVLGGLEHNQQVTFRPVRAEA